MPRLPDASDRRPTPTPQRGIVQAAQSDMGRTMAVMGKRLSDRADDEILRQSKFDYERAKAHVLTASIEAESALDEDNDFQTYEQRYGTRLNQVRQEALNLISDPLLREQFQLDMDVMTARGMATVKAKRRAKEKDFGRATLLEQLERNRTAALSGSDADSLALLGNASEMIGAAVDRGYLGAEEAASTRMKFVENYATDRIQMRPLEEQIRLLTSKPGPEKALLEVAGKAGAKHGVDGLVLARIAMLESSGKPDAVNPKSGAAGLFQFMPDTAKAYRLTDAKNAEAAADAAARLLKDNRATLAQRLGREPTPAELYLAHQQGAGGASVLLSNPDGNVVDVLAKAYKGDRNRALAAIEQNGGSADMTAGQFADLWRGRYESAASPDGVAVATMGRTGTEADYLPPDVRFKILTKAQAEFEKQAELTAALTSYGNPDFLYDPGNKDHREAVDKIFTAQGGIQAVKSMSEEGATALMSVAQRTGILPAPAQGALRAMMENGNVQQKAYAYDLVARMQEDAPRVLDQFKENEISQAALYNKYIRDGMDQKTALEYVDARFSKADEAVREMRKASVNKLLKELDKKLPDTVEDIFDPGAFTVGPDLPRNSAAADQAKAAYRDAFETEYLMHGDEEVAKARATERMRRMYGETRATGKRTIMRRPPEAYYAIPGVDNGWMQEQLMADVRALEGEQDTKLDDLELLADTVTEADVSAGRLPRYQVLRKSKDGIWDVLRDADGKVLHYRFDQQKIMDGLGADQKAERAKILERAQIYRDIAKQGYGEAGRGWRAVVPEAVPRAIAWAGTELRHKAPSKQKQAETREATRGEVPVTQNRWSPGPLPGRPQGDE